MSALDAGPDLVTVGLVLAAALTAWLFVAAACLFVAVTGLSHSHAVAESEQPADRERRP